MVYHRDFLTREIANKLPETDKIIPPKSSIPKIIPKISKIPKVSLGKIGISPKYETMVGAEYKTPMNAGKKP